MVNEIINLYGCESDREFLKNNVHFIEDAIKRAKNDSDKFIKKCCDYLLATNSAEFKVAAERYGGTYQNFYAKVWCKQNKLSLLGIPSPSEKGSEKIVDTYRKFLQNNLFEDDCRFNVTDYSDNAIAKLNIYNVELVDGYVVPKFNPMIKHKSVSEFKIGDSIEELLSARNDYLINRDNWYLEMVDVVKNELLENDPQKNSSIVVLFDYTIEPLMKRLSDELTELGYCVTYNNSEVIIEWKEIL